MKKDFSEYNDIKKLFSKNNYNNSLDCSTNRSNYVVIYPPTIDWAWMKQRPQQLMEQFSLSGFEVYYCNKTQSKTKFYTPISSNLKIIHNNYNFISKTIPVLKKKGKKIILWVSWSKLHLFLEAYSPNYIIYDFLDDFAQWKPYHEKMVNLANIVVTTSAALNKQILQQFPNKKRFLIPNGCDIKHFKQPANIQKPHEFKTHDGPIITYIGAWAKWIDQKLVNRIAIEFKEALVVIIGAEFGVKVSKSQPNIKYLGYKPYRILPSYLKYSTVCIIPFKIDSITIATNPIKMYEYLASGKPVVSTNIPEARNIPSVHIGEDHKSFIQKIRFILDGKIKFDQDYVYSWIEQQTWEKRFSDILGILKQNGIYKKPKNYHL